MRTTRNGKFSLYAHVPFCRSKCPYCAFYSFRPRAEQVALWTERVVRELKSLARGLDPGARLSTIYFGGGTPSYLGAAQWEPVFEALDSFERADGCEFTVEANPESVSREKLLLWRDNGVNRISLGVQSLVDSELRTLARPHTAARALDALRACLEAGFRVGADLMFALPGQTLRSWHKSLNGLLGEGVEHISVYQLTIEPDSFWGKRAPGNLPDGYPFYRWAQYFLPRRGLRQYEIASFAVRGRESRHNLAYWRRENVLAAGPGAWGFLDGTRFANAKNLERWADAVREGGSPREYEERPIGLKAASEAAVLALRTSEGIVYDEFARAYGRDALERVLARLRGVPPEDVRWRSGGVSLSPRGMRVGNAIWSELIDLDEQAGERGEHERTSAGVP